MAHNSAKSTIREAVGVFNEAETLQAAIDELESSGFNRSEISLLAGEQTVEEKLGHAYARAEELEDDPEVPRTMFISTEAIGDAEGALIGAPLYVAALAATGAIVASGGTLGAAIIAAAAAGGAGAAVGAFLAGVVGRHHAEYLESQLGHGGLLLWVRTRDVVREERAMGILSKHSAHDVHMHDIAA